MSDNPEDIVTPAVDPGLTSPPPAPGPVLGPEPNPALNGHAPRNTGPVPTPADPFAKLQGDVGLIFRELGDINARTQATQIQLLIGLAALTFVVIFMIRANAAAGAKATP